MSGFHSPRFRILVGLAGSLAVVSAVAGIDGMGGCMFG
jgi:hypothetical protein